MNKQEVLDVLTQVYDPDYRDRSVVDMGLVDEDSIEIEGDTIKVQYRVTAPMCPFSAALGLMIKHALEKKLGKAVEVAIEPGHYQQQLVNDILTSEEKAGALFEKLVAFGILEQCVRI